MSQLIVLTVSLKGREVRTLRFDQDQVVIGRDSNADVRLDNAGVSRTHALIRRTGDQFVLLDQGSSNGTSLQGQRVAERRILDGDRIQIGKFEIAVSLPTDALPINLRIRDRSEQPSLLPPGSTVRVGDAEKGDARKTAPAARPMNSNTAALTLGVLAIALVLVIAAIVLK